MNFSSVEPFLYSSLLQRILRFSSPCPIALWAGRNLGKTTVLRRLYGASEADESRQLIRCRSVDAPEKILAWNGSPSGPLFLDDIDGLRPDDALELVLGLLEDGSEHQVVVTVRDAERLPATGGFERFRVDPWHGDWEAVLTQAITASVHEFSSLPGAKSMDSEVLTAWTEKIRDLTGGYPALVHSAVRYLGLLLVDREGLNTPNEARLVAGPGEGSGLDSWKTRVQVHLEDHLVDRALPLISSTVRDLRGRRPDLFRQLVRVARREAEVEDSFTRRELRDTGLAYTHTDGRLVLASPLIEQWIHHIAERDEDRRLAPRPRRSSPPGPQTMARRRATLQIDGSDLYEGVLRYTTEDGVSAEIAVSGGPWRVLRCLDEAEGQPRSVTDLAKDANLGTDTAVRSALQRLQKLLKDNRLGNVVDNVRGKGYRLSKYPVFEPE